MCVYIVVVIKYFAKARKSSSTRPQMGISSTFRHLAITLAADAGSDFTPRWLLLPRMTSGNSITYLVFVCVSFLPAPPLLSLTTDTSVLWPVSPGFFFSPRT